MQGWRARVPNQALEFRYHFGCILGHGDCGHVPKTPAHHANGVSQYVLASASDGTSRNQMSHESRSSSDCGPAAGRLSGPRLFSIMLGAGAAVSDLRRTCGPAGCKEG